MPLNNKKYTIERLKGSFHRALPQRQFNQLVHFVAVRKLLAECPGDYVCYRWYHNRVAVATSEPNINQWLDLHGLEPREDGEFQFKPVRSSYNGHSTYSFSDGAKMASETLQEEIMFKLNNGATLTSIANELGCTVANIYYHKNRYHKRMAKLEVDNS
jgi:DNA-binding CsgD family transcriptional regulator